MCSQGNARSRYDNYYVKANIVYARAVNIHTYVKSIFHLIRRARTNEDTPSTRNIAFSFAICSYTRMHVRSLMARDVVIW